MSATTAPVFSGHEQEAAYYRIQCKDLQDELEDVKAAMAEFQASSRELEDEMEKELAITERRENDLRQEVERVKGEVESWKGRHQDTLKEHSRAMQLMQQELEGLRKSEVGLRAKLRDIELDNDDLEKNERAISSTLSDVESRYNRAIERTALLEQELVDKARLEEDLQRARDELRDNLEELAVSKAQREEALIQAESLARQAPASESLNIPMYGTHILSQSTSVTSQHSVGLLLESSRPSVPSPNNDLADESSPTRPGSLYRPSESHSSAVTSSSAVSHSPGHRGPSGLATIQVAGGDRRKALSKSAHNVNANGDAPVNSSSPNTAREKRSEGLISDMRDLTQRMQSMSKTLNAKRESLMAGSAIPRATPRKSLARQSSSSLGSSHHLPHYLPDIAGYPPDFRRIPLSAATADNALSRSISLTDVHHNAPQSSSRFKSPALPRPRSRLSGYNTRTPDSGSGIAHPPSSARLPSHASQRGSFTVGHRPETPSSIPRSPTPAQGNSSGRNEEASRIRKASLAGRRHSSMVTASPQPPPTDNRRATVQDSKRTSLMSEAKSTVAVRPTQPSWR